MKPSLLPLLLPLTPMSGMIFRSEWGKAPAPKAKIVPKTVPGSGTEVLEVLEVVRVTFAAESV